MDLYRSILKSFYYICMLSGKSSLNPWTSMSTFSFSRWQRLHSYKPHGGKQTSVFTHTYGILLIHMDLITWWQLDDSRASQNNTFYLCIYAGTEIYQIVSGNPQDVHSKSKFIAIRSEKAQFIFCQYIYCSWVWNVVDVSEFQSLFRPGNGSDKPVVIIGADVRPDENIEYQKVVSFVVQEVWFGLKCSRME